MSVRHVKLDELQPGDIVECKSGILRTVLSVSRRPTQVAGTRSYLCVTFPILKCTWTKRGTTSYGRWDLEQMFVRAYRPQTTRLKSKVARKLFEEMKSARSLGYCCLVKGVLE